MINPNFFELNPFDNISLIIFSLLLFIALPLKGQVNWTKEQNTSKCFISSITIESDESDPGFNSTIHKTVFDIFSDLGFKNIDLYLGNNYFLSGNLLSCGTNNIQVIITDSNDNVSTCELVIIKKCVNGTSKPVIEVYNNQSVGYISAFWESGEKGPGAISNNDGDPGGKSYGTYQISSNHGYLENFFDNEGLIYKPLFEAYELKSPAFDSIWTMVAEEEPDFFHNMQHEFIKRTHYLVFCERLKEQLGIDLRNYSPIIKEVIWSTAVQHGPYNNIVNFALAGMDLNILCEKTIIELIYKERGLTINDRLFYYPRTKPETQKNLMKRFSKEKDFAISKL